MRIKVYFKEYGAADWSEWTQYLTESPALRQYVESENEGEAGLITFDQIGISFYNDNDTPIKTAFETNWNASKKYLFKIELGDETGTFYKKFEGLTDFLTLSFPEKGKTVSFDVTDRLASIGVIESHTGRNKNVNISSRFGITDSRHLHFWTDENDQYLYFAYWNTNKGEYQGEYDNFTDTSIVNPGEIFIIDEKLCLIKGNNSAVFESFTKDNGDPVDPGGNYNAQVVRVDIITAEEIENKKNNPYKLNELSPDYFIYEKNYYGSDINVISSGAVTAFDGFKVIEALVQNTWNEISILNQTGDEVFEIPPQLFIELVSSEPFGEHPSDAIKLFADSLQSYIYINEFDELVITKRTALGSIGNLRSLGNTIVFDGEKKPIWDKLVDAVQITVLSGIKEGGDYLSGYAEVRKNAGIKPRNPIEKEIFLTDESVIDQTGLNNFAAAIANQYLNFYGYRHIAYSLTVKLDSNTINWKLLDRIEIDGTIYFIASLEYREDNTADLELVSINTFDYDPKSVLFPKKESAARKITYATASGNIFTTQNPYLWDGGPEGLNPALGRQSLGIAGDVPISFDALTGLIRLHYTDRFTVNENGELDIDVIYAFNPPLSLNNNEVDLLYTDNFKLTSNQLDTIQNIKITSAVQFGSMGLGGAPSTEKLKVYGDANVTGNLAVGADINVTGLISKVDSIRNYINLNCDGDTPGAIGGGIKLLGTSGALIAEIIYNGTEWAFNKPLNVDGTVTLSQATTTNHALRASRTLQITGTTNRVIIDNSSARNLTNDLSWNLTLPQDFHTAAVIQLARVGLGVAAESGYSLKATLPIKLTSGNTSLITGGLQHPSYQSQTSNWRLTSNGQLDVRYLYTDELHARTFIADLEQALVGSEIITKSVAKLLSDFTIPAAGGSATLYIESMPGFETAAMFQDGDIIRLRQWDRTGGSLSIANVWGTVVLLDYNDTNEPPYQRYTFTRSTGGRAGSAAAGSTIKKGTLALDYGQGSGGYYEINAIDGLNGSNSPYAQAVTWEDHPADGLFVKSRVGNLSGTTSPIYGAHKGFGGYFQRMYAMGAVSIAGSLSAGDSSGFDHTFLAGRLNKNLVDNSRNVHSSSQWFGSLATIANVDQEIDPQPNPVGVNKYVATISSLSGDGDTNGYAYWYKGGLDSGWYSVGFWIKNAEEGTNTKFRVVLRMYDGSYHELDEYVGSVGQSWRRISLTGYASMSGELSVIIFPYYDASTPGRGKIYFNGFQVENDEVSSNYVPTDGSTNLVNYGMWSIYGGFGGVPQAPVIQLDDSGFVLKARSAYAKALGSNEIRIGHITGTAANAIKITDTGTASTSGIFVYDGSAQEVVGLKRSGEHNLSGFKIEYNKLSNQGLRLEAGGESVFTGLAVNDGTRDRLKIGHNAGDLDKSGLEVSRISVTLSNYNFGSGSAGWTIGSGDYTYKPEIVVSNQVYNGIGNLNLGSNAMVIKGGQRTTSETLYQNTAQQPLLGGSTVLSNQKAILKMDVRVVEYLNADLDYRLRVIISADGTKIDIDAEIDLSTISHSGYTTILLSMDCESPHNTSGYIKFEASALKKTLNAENHIYNAIAIDNIDILTYTNTSITHISDGDVELYYNPFNNIRFNSGGVYMNMDRILFNGVAMGRYRGSFYNSMPTKDNRAGDYGFLLDTSTQKVAYYVPQRGWKLASLT